MVPLAQAAVARGHDLLWAVPADGVAEVERRGIHAEATSPALPIGPALAIEHYPELAQLPPAEAPEVMFGKLWGAIAAPEMLAGLIPVARDWRPDLVVADAAEFAGHIIAAELGVPSVTKGFGPLLPEERVASAAREVAPLWRSRGLEPRPYGGAYDVLYLDNYPPLLQAQEAVHVRRRQHIRPTNDAVDEASLSTPLLPVEPADAPLVYVTMGTIFNDPERFTGIVEAITDLPVRALVTVGPKGDPDAFGVPPRGVRFERYVPQGAVLQHCDLVVSHGGSGTALGALEFGLPQLCLPQGADQFLNAAAIVSVGAGLALRPDEVCGETVGDAALRLLTEPSFREAAEQVKASIASMPTAEEAVVTLETLT
jgi:UDP:flavonoid glycosyltransferase YjiC (YdhE family)